MDLEPCRQPALIQYPGNQNDGIYLSENRTKLIKKKLAQFPYFEIKFVEFFQRIRSVKFAICLINISVRLFNIK